MASGIRNADELEELLGRLDGRGYKAYKQLQGPWGFGDFILTVDHVQGDPFADPSRVTVTVDSDVAGFPQTAFASRARALGVGALIARTFARAAADRSKSRGSGKSGVVHMEDPGQIVGPQTAAKLHADGGVEARFTVGLPANGRRIAGREAVALLLDDTPGVVRSTLSASNYDADVMELHAAVNEDADALRAALAPAGLVAFLGDDARLPRRSGVDDRPLEDGSVVPFRSPPELRVTVELPNAGAVTGMGVPEGVTLIVGGGFHGKSTVLRAVQDGVYNHPPGDGRERAVTRECAVKVRAEDGRSVAGVDISAFIDGLPFGRTTDHFTTANASGSTSQAAAIAEALEAGADILLVDEDTAATNFMIRDRRMQELVPAEREPITPFIDRVRTLHRRRGVSTVLVLGGSGDYLDVADHVVRMTRYQPEDVTDRARVVAESFPTERAAAPDEPLEPTSPRVPSPGSIDAARGKRRRYVRVPDDRTLVVGREAIDLAAVEQIILRGQARAIGMALARVGELADGTHSVEALLDSIEDVLDAEGLDGLADRRVGDLAAFRRFELAAALNRIRSLRVEGP